MKYTNLEAAGAAAPGAAATAADESPAVALAHPAVAAGLDVLEKESKLFMVQCILFERSTVLCNDIWNSGF